MKIYGLLGVLILTLSVGENVFGQSIAGSSSPRCQNCSQAVSFPAETVFTDGSQPQTQPIYHDSSVAQAGYIAPVVEQAVAPVATTSYSMSSTRQPTSRTTTGSFAANVRTGLAQRKAAAAARMGLRGHLGGGLGGAKFEGVGWSNQSAQSAIQSCCYWGARPVSEIGVARGVDGYWYACVLYR